MSATYFRTEDAAVTISDAGRRKLADEGLRRAANDNDLLIAAPRTHEILAGTACGLIAVAIVWAIFRSL